MSLDHTPMQEPRSSFDEPRPLREIMADVWENTDKLVVNRMQLGMLELERRVDLLKNDLSVFSTGAVFIHAGVLSAVAAVILALSTVLAPWLSALLVSIAVAAVGYVLLRRAPRDMRAHLAGKPNNKLTEGFRRSGHDDTAP